MIYCPRCAARLIERDEQGLTRQVCGSCGFVEYRNPLPVAACIVEATDGIYLIQRRCEPAAGRWALPAGYIEHAEEPAAAAAREVLEETGLEVRIVGLVGAYGYVERDGQRSGIVIAYHGRVTGGQPRAGDDAAAIRLLARTDLLATLAEQPPALAFATHQAALRDWLGR